MLRGTVCYQFRVSAVYPIPFTTAPFSRTQDLLHPNQFSLTDLSGRIQIHFQLGRSTRFVALIFLCVLAVRLTPFTTAAGHPLTRPKTYSNAVH